MRTSSWFVVVVAGVWLVGCGTVSSSYKTVEAQPPAKETTETAVQETVSTESLPTEHKDEVVQTINRWSFDLFKRINKSGNLVVSPYSLYMALSTLHLGSTGKTAEDLAKALNYTTGYEEMHGKIGRLFNSNTVPFRKDDDPALQIETAVWIKEGYQIDKTYKDRVFDFYHSTTRNLDFEKNPDRASTEINNWVSMATHGNIQKMSSPGDFNSETRLVVTNTVFMEALWYWQFPEKNTQKEKFYVSKSRSRTVPMMQRVMQGVDYFEDNIVQLVRLPYELHRGELSQPEKSMSMVIVLPKEKAGLSNVENTLTQDFFHTWLNGTEEYDVEMKMPRFEISSRLDAKATLSEMGMENLFLPSKADLSGISREPLWLDNVVQNTWIVVNEKGTKVAGASLVLMSGGVSDKRASFHADHPFLYVIRDDVSGAILFIGRVVSP